MKRASPTSPFGGPHDSYAYRNAGDSQGAGLGAISHKLHRITFVEACIFQPPDLQSPVRPGMPSLPPPGPPGPGGGPPLGPPGPLPPFPRPMGPPMLATGERSPTSTGGTQYYQEWTSKHMRHLCSRFEKPSQQQLLMNVERKSKYPFIILCLPEASCLSSLSRLNSTSTSTSTSSGQGGSSGQRYRREMSHHSAYSIEGCLEDEEGEGEGAEGAVDDEDNWITQKQRDSINSHYLPPPPPPIGQPHIWPEIRYVDGLYTVCAMIARPGSGMPDPPELDNGESSFYLGQDMMEPQSSYSEHNPFHQQQQQQQQRPGRHISFQQDHDRYGSSSGGGGGGGGRGAPVRPAGYIVSAFATFPGEDSERLEKNWLLWTGKQIKVVVVERGGGGGRLSR